jgi:cell division protein FtsN
MSVDPTQPLTPEDPDDVEAYGGPTTNGEFGERDAEAPEADAAEQRTDLLRRGDDAVSAADLEQAAEADAAEQARSVGPDDDDAYDDYR